MISTESAESKQFAEIVLFTSQMEERDGDKVKGGGG